MARPALTLAVDLSQQDSVYYLPLGAKSNDDEERIKLAVRLRITHDDPDHDELTISAISFSFPGTDIQKIDMGMVPEKNMTPEDGKLRRGDTASWYNGSWRDANDDWHRNQVYLDTPAPRRITFHISCEETSQAFTETFDLLPWTGEPLLLPFAVEDLDEDEYIVTSAVHNYNGVPGGTQIFAHDISIQARVDGEWTRSRIATPTSNEDSRIFGRAVRAQGDGVVHAVESGFWDNDYGAGNRTDHYGSNTVWVDYGNLRVGYMHLRRDSIGSQIVPGLHVQAGRKLGEAGNSGNTKGSPHLHMECRLLPDGKLCGMTFKKSWMLARALVPADGTHGPRVNLKSRGICKETAALRPFARRHVPLARKSVEELDSIVAEVFGGTSKGGDGFVIVNGKITRVPPRGIKSDLLKALVALDEADELSGAEAGRRATAVAGMIESTLRKLKAGR